MCSHLQYFTHRIHSSPLWSSEKRPVQNTQSAPCSPSSSVESLARGTANSVSESDGTSDGVGSWQTLLFRLFEGPRRAFDASRQVLDLVACLIWSELPQNILCMVNSLFSLLLHHKNLDLVRAWHRADIWWSERISRSEWRKIRRKEWRLNVGLHQSRVVHRSSIYVSWRQRETVWFEDVHVTREKACRPAAISRCRACCSLLVFSEQFSNLVDGDESPWVWTETFFNLW
jgi:hypothetical protein